MIGKKEELYISPIPISYPLKPVSQKSQFVLSKNLHQRLWTKGISLTLMKFKDLGINFFSYLFHCDLTTFFICYYLSISLKKKKNVHACILSCVWLCNPIDCSPPGSSVYGIFQARILEWVAISYSRGLLNPRIETQSLGSPALAGRFFTTVLPGNHLTKRLYWKEAFSNSPKGIPQLKSGYPTESGEF